MNPLRTITASHNGKVRTLTYPEWARVLNVSVKTLYNRRTIGLSDQDIIDGNYKSGKSRTRITDRRLAELYRLFNFSHGIINLERQRNGIR